MTESNVERVARENLERSRSIEERGTPWAFMLALTIILAIGCILASGLILAALFIGGIVVIGFNTAFKGYR